MVAQKTFTFNIRVKEPDSDADNATASTTIPVGSVAMKNIYPDSTLSDKTE